MIVISVAYQKVSEKLFAKILSLHSKKKVKLNAKTVHKTTMQLVHSFITYTICLENVGKD